MCEQTDVWACLAPEGAHIQVRIFSFAAHAKVEINLHTLGIIVTTEHCGHVPAVLI